MATAYSKPTLKKPWRAPVMRKLEGVEAERVRQVMIDRGQIPPHKNEE